MPTQNYVAVQMGHLIEKNFFISTFYHATRRTLEGLDLKNSKLETALKVCRNIYYRYKDTDDGLDVKNAITYIFRKIKDELELGDDINIKEKFKTEFKKSMKSNAYYHIYGVGMHTDIKKAEQQLGLAADKIWDDTYNQKFEKDLWDAQLQLDEMVFSDNPYTPMWYKCVLSFSIVGIAGLGVALAVELSFFHDTFQSIEFYQCLGLTALLLLSAYLLYNKGNDYYYPGIKKEIEVFKETMNDDKVYYYDPKYERLTEQNISTSEIHQ